MITPSFIYKEHMSISSIISANLSNIVGDHSEYSDSIAKLMPELREKLLKEGRIITFQKTQTFNKSMVAVDGARVTEDLAGGDLLVVGATAGEGHSSSPLYTEDNVPTEAWASMLPHKTNNKDIVSDIMSALELRVLKKVDSDLKIIDGSYLQNVSVILYALAGTNRVDVQRVDTLLKAIDGDSDGLLETSMQEVIYPDRDNTSRIISLPKSDTAKIYSKEFFEDEHILSGISDRIIASRILLPGEMFTPRNIRSNDALISRLSTFDAQKYDGQYKDIYDSLLDGKAGLLTRLNNINTEEGILWTSYFKPYAATPQSKAMKIEFSYYKNNVTNLKGAVEHAEKLISFVDQDVIDSSILEPWCQYMADVRAKDASAGTNIIKNYMIANAVNSYDIAGLLRGYRT